MADFVNLVMLVAASIGSMAFGILAAYSVLRAGFALMRPAGKPMQLTPRVATKREVGLGS